MAEHCWHDTGTVCTSDPPVRTEVCCQCGLFRRLRTHRLGLSGHGPHMPMHAPFYGLLAAHVESEPSGPCKPTDTKKE